MKKNINYIKIDSTFKDWLLEKLNNELPCSEFCEEIKQSLNDMNCGLSQGILLCENFDDQSTYLTEEKSSEIKYGELTIVPKSRKVFIHNENVVLTPKEYDILFFLANNIGEIFTKEQIYKAVWDNDYLLDDSNIMAFIRKLRKKIEPNPDSPIYILTVWGIGYKFNDEI